MLIGLVKKLGSIFRHFNTRKSWIIRLNHYSFAINSTIFINTINLFRNSVCRSRNSMGAGFIKSKRFSKFLAFFEAFKLASNIVLSYNWRGTSWWVWYFSPFHIKLWFIIWLIRLANEPLIIGSSRGSVFLFIFSFIRNLSLGSTGGTRWAFRTLWLWWSDSWKP